jgi:hypothetical protein
MQEDARRMLEAEKDRKLKETERLSVELQRCCSL